ncbi:MAG: NAD-dependent epimerase/dehydratase family protein, partial [Cytophagaceae bacterium]
MSLTRVQPAVMLLGGTGFIGSNLSLSLRLAGYRVVVLTRPGRLLTVSDGCGEATYVSVDLADTIALEETLAREQPVAVLHLASNLKPASTVSEYLEYERLIAAPTKRLLQLLPLTSTRFIFFSSGGTVYGPTSNADHLETDACAPINHYGQSKLEMESFVRFCGRTAGLDYLILRPSNPYGPGQMSNGTQGFVSVALNKALNDQALDIWGDGSAVRDYVYIDDL